MRLEKCQDTCIVKIQASLEENMYPLWRNISAGTADRKQLGTTHTRESSSLYIILQMTPTEKQFSLNPLGWRIGTPGLLEHSDRWERFCQQLTSLEAITAYSVPSIRMVAYVMYVCVLQSDSHSQIRKKSHPMWKERKVAQNTMQILSPPEQGGLGTRLASLITMRLISVLVDRGERV